MRLKKISMWLFIFLIFLFLFDSFAFAADPATGAAGVICDFLRLLTGRTMRAICVIVIMGMAFLCFNGSISWQKALTVVAGFGLIFGAKNFAVMILASKITNVSGQMGNKVFYKTNEYTPEEVIAAACPSL